MGLRSYIFKKCDIGIFIQCPNTLATPENKEDRNSVTTRNQSTSQLPTELPFS